MKSAKLLELLVLIVTISAAAGLSNKAKMLLKDNTPLYTIYQAEGFITQTSAGLGLNGTDVGICKPPITGDIVLNWGLPSTARVDVAFLLWQAASDLDQPNFKLSLDGVAVTNSSNVTAGAACNKITGTQKYIKNAWGFVSEVTDQVAAKLKGTSSATVSFGIRFEVDCSSKKLAAANGVSLMVVAFDKSLPYTYIEVRAGAFAYDQKFNQGSGQFGVFTNVFEIPPVGILPGDRVAEKVLLLTSIIGEGEDFGMQELSEGFYLNGEYVTYPIDGSDVGGRWDTLHIPLDSYVSDTDTKVNFTVVSPLDCLLFVGQAIQFEKQPGNSSNITDIVEDPHVRTWDGVGVTVFVEGDYVLVESQSLGLAVHARFCKNSRGPWAPWTCALAVRCDAASPLVEVVADSFVATTSPGDNAPVVTQASEHVKGITCANGLRASVVRHRFHRMSYLNVRLALTAGVVAHDLRGLSGTPNGNPTDDLQWRDGRLFKLEAARGHYIAHTSAELDAIHTSWMVAESERMFSSPFPSTAAVTAHSSLRGSLASRAAIAALARSPSARSIRRLAEQQCRAAGLRGVVETAMCVHDAIALGSASAAPNLAAFLSAVRDL